MPIYKVNIEVAKTPHRKTILTALPDVELSIGSEQNLSPIEIMQFVRNATAKIMENLEGVTVYATENQTIWNAYTDNENFDLLLTFTDFKIVDKPSDWHVVADAVDVMKYIYFTSNDGDFDEDDHQIWFDCDLPNVMTKESAGDYDNEVRASGNITFNRHTHEIQVELTDEFLTCEKIFQFTSAKAYLVKLMAWLYSQPNFRELNISNEEIEKEVAKERSEEATPA